MEKGWQRVYINNQLHNVEIVRAVLSDHDIDSFVVDKRDSSYITIGDIEVYVRDENAVLAKVIIEENVL
jgi:hypothetical protein